MKRLHPPRPGSRGGYTLAELLAIIVIAGIMATIAVPRLSGAIRHLSARSAVSQVVSDLTLARTQAVREGRTVSLRLTGASTYRITLDQGVNVVRVLKTVDIAGTQKNVTIGPTSSVVSFNPRGMVSTGGTRLLITRGTQTDTLSISAVGRVYRGE